MEMKINAYIQYVGSETLKKPIKPRGFLIFNFSLTNLSGLGVSSHRDFVKTKGL